MKFFKQMFCKHEYLQFNRVANPADWDYNESYYEYRVCKKCGISQEFQPHCLGLNPPQYIASWRKIPKDKKLVFKNNKVVRIK